jgi:hypothetical protein
MPPTSAHARWVRRTAIGEDTGTPVSEDYKVPFRFTGDLRKVTINLAGANLTEEQLQRYREGRLKAALAQ